MDCSATELTKNVLTCIVSLNVNDSTPSSISSWNEVTDGGIRSALLIPAIDSPIGSISGLKLVNMSLKALLSNDKNVELVSCPNGAFERILDRSVALTKMVILGEMVVDLLPVVRLTSVVELARLVR